MLTNPTLDMLRELGLSGMARAFQELETQPEARALQHGEWLALLLEREATTRRQKRFDRFVQQDGGVLPWGVHAAL